MGIRKKLSLILSFVLMLALLTALPAAAATGNLHFNEPPVFSVVGNSLNATGTVYGAGVDDITAVLSATVNVTCANPGKNTDVPGQRKTVSSQATVIHPENGHANFNLTTAPAVGGCPNGQWVPSYTFTDAVLNFYQGGALVLSAPFVL